MNIEKDRSLYHACKRILKFRGDPYAGDIRLRGLEAIYAMRDALHDLREAWPDRIFELSCDDSGACGAALFILTDEIQGGDGMRWNGITMLFIPQCTGEPPTFIHLSDDEFNGLREAVEQANLRASGMLAFGDDGQDPQAAAIDDLDAFERRYKHCTPGEKMSLLMEMRIELQDRIHALDAQMNATRPC